MMDTQSLNPARPSPKGDLLLAGLAWAVGSTGLLLGGRPLWIALVVLALPMVAFLAIGFLAGRGGVIACLVAAIGVAIMDGTGATDPGLAVIVLGMLVSAAGFGGIQAGRLVPASNRRRITIEVEYRGMPDSTPANRRSRAEIGRTRPDRVTAHCV